MRILLFILSLCLTANVAVADTIHLRTGPLGASSTKSAEKLELGYAIIQLSHVPTPEERAALEQSGIELIRYLPERAWWARISKGAKKVADVSGIVFAVTADQVDKVEPELRKRLEKESAVAALVLFLPGVDNADAALKASGFAPEWMEISLAKVMLTAATLPALNAIPGVEWIDLLPPPDKPHNVTSVARISAGVLQTPPYNLDGSGVGIGLWEANGVPFLHDEIKDNTTILDLDAPVSDHATHVAGTLIGKGAIEEVTRGFAPAATIRARDVISDIPEMRAEADGGFIQLSNHSYGTRSGWDYDGGWVDYGVEFFGSYSALSYFWDDIVLDTNLLVFKSAGNDRNDDPDGAGPIVGDGPYDTVEHRGASKNVITLGALNDNDTMASFSSWGPADDGRVKPDLCANGVGLFSTMPGNAFGFMSGTSMSTPSACGAAALLLQHYRNTFSEEPTAAALKGLMIHAANDLGRPGPDYEFGWGIINAAGAASLLENSLFREGMISNGNTVSYVVEVPEGVERLRASLIWTDIPGSPSALRALVNDLDLVIRDPEGNVHLPFVLDKENPTENAVTGRNEVDNVEQVVLESPVAGTWSIEVSGHQIPEGAAAYVVVSEAFGDLLNTVGEGVTDTEGEGEAAEEGNPEGEEGEIEGVGPCASAPLVIDFCADFLRVRNNTLLANLDEEFQPLVEQLDPATADINGIYFVDISDLNNPVIQVQGNGIPDASNELALLQEILADPCFDNGRVTHAQVRAAWDANKKQLVEQQIGTDLYSVLSIFIRGLDNLLVAYTVLGDGDVLTRGESSASGEGSFGIVAGLIHIIDAQISTLTGENFLNPTLEREDFIAIDALQHNKNADRDAFSNRAEFEHFASRECAVPVTTPDYPFAALRTAVYPGQENPAEGEGASEGEGILEGEGAGDGEGESEGEGEGEVGNEPVYHGSDTSPDHVLTLNELLRPLQFYNAGGFSCAAELGEDVYAATQGDCSSCTPYTADYEAPHCTLSLSELLRLIQIFNVGAYYACDSPDGFCPGVNQ